MTLNTHSSQELKILSNKLKNHRMRLRLLAVSHFKSGKNRAEVARTLNISRRIVNDWVANYLSEGLLGLESKKPTGRPSYLTEQDKEILSQYIKAQCQSDMGGRLTGECRCVVPRRSTFWTAKYNDKTLKRERRKEQDPEQLGNNSLNTLIFLVLFAHQQAQLRH